MIQPFVDAFMSRREELRAVFAAQHPKDYDAVVKALVGILPEVDGATPDPSRVHKIDDGDYQGTLIFVIGADGYQPSTYWYVKVGYGSCSGCDTLEAIRDFDDEAPSAKQVDEYLTLALHVVQGLKKMSEDVT